MGSVEILTLEATREISIPATASLDQWIEAGRHLAKMKKRLGFMIGDWVNHGREHFPDQMELALDSADIDPKFALKAANVARMFPVHCRADDLSFDHHRALVKLPADERLGLLQEARKGHWDVGEVKEAVTQWRYEHGQLFDDEDIDTHLCTLIVKAWNRGTPDARKLFMELATIAKTGVIDEDEAA
jgi:hypothetical protein